MKIKNISYNDIVSGNYEEMDNCCLIQIQDPSHSFPVPKKDFFKCKYKFWIQDLEWYYNDDKQITDILFLRYTLEILAYEKYNIIVHCSAGVSRSGAVVEKAIELGYDDPKTRRTPNAKLLELLK